MLVLSTYHEHMKRAISAFGGTLDKYLGDGIMASFGTPTPDEHDGENTVSAALAMLESLEGVNAALPTSVGTSTCAVGKRRCPRIACAKALGLPDRYAAGRPTDDSYPRTMSVDESLLTDRFDMFTTEEAQRRLT